MRVILDECIPRPLGALLIGHSVTTVRRQGWSGTKNGKLLNLIESGGFEAFITMDKSFPNQNLLSGLAFGVIILRARSNKLADLNPLVPKLVVALAALTAGTVQVIA
ncbi:MAG: DUF5615 family PIN-like protein [Pseudomonadota bacterium]